MPEKDLLTLDDLRRIHEEGIPQRLISGVEVRIRPAQLDKLIQMDSIPDVLTPILLKALYEDTRDDLNDFLLTPRDDKEQALAVIRSVDAVCNAVLIDPSIVSYLSLSDRMWIFKLAFMPVEALRSFRYEPTGDVDNVAESEIVRENTE